MVEKLADMINMEELVYSKEVRGRYDKAIVSMRNNGLLFFNPKMVELLGIAKWDAVVVGIDKSTGILVLKLADVEEYGSVVVRIDSSNNSNPVYAERAKRCRTVCVRHLNRNLDIELSKQYRAERDGEMIFLKAAE